MYHVSVNIHHVTSLDLPELQVYRTLRRPLEHQQLGIFVAEGEKVVRQLVKSDLKIVSLLITPEWLDVCRSLLETRAGSFEVYVTSKKTVESIVGFPLHQGIMAVGKIPATLNLDDLMAATRKPSLLVAVDGLTNSENLGVLVRNCAAFGVDGVLVGETSSHPYLRRAVRNSMGTVFTLPVVSTDNLAASLRHLQKTYDLSVIGAHPHEDQRLLPMLDLKNGVCLVFGHEGKGLSEAVRAVCNVTAAIPMHNGVDSINVASANAVFLYEAARQRNEWGKRT